MTVQLNFDKTNQQRLLQMLDWLQGIGLLRSYELEASSSSISLENQETAMVEAGLRQIENGQVMSHEEARKKIEERLRNFKK